MRGINSAPLTSVRLESVARSRALILDAVGSPADVALVVCGRGVSDGLVAAGARELLRGVLPYREVGLEELAAEGGETALLVGGGLPR